ncbi:MAG: nitroreductase family protein [Firmicutes bacterium]|jgi:nitroreductase|nr:nitroreductase family protein [Bacillota bacterium]
MLKSVAEAIRERRSVRRFAAGDIPDTTLSKLLEAACLAPSAGNRQPWFFYVVKDPKVREDLAKAAFGQSFLKEAPVDIVVCVEPERSATRYGERGAELYCFQDTAAAAQNILLMAEGLGLSTCWVGAFDEKAVSQILEIPSGRRPVAIIPVGYSILAAPPKPPARRTLDEVVKIVN